MLLLSNVWRMHHWVMAREPGLKVPLAAYGQALSTLITHCFTQKQWLSCQAPVTSWTATRWFKHFCVVAGYITMFVLIVGFLRWFQTDTVHPVWHPQRWLGYLATAALLFGVGSALRGRWHRREELPKHSHPSDWNGPTWLTARALVQGELEKFQGLKGYPDPIKLFDGIRALGGRMILCELAFAAKDIQPGQVREGVEVMKAPPFLMAAEGATMTLTSQRYECWCERRRAGGRRSDPRSTVTVWVAIRG